MRNVRIILFCCLSFIQFSCISGVRNEESDNLNDSSSKTVGIYNKNNIEVKKNKQSIKALNNQDFEFDLLNISQLHASFRNLYKSWDKMSDTEKKSYFNERFAKEKYIGYFFSEWG